ncbi:aluminum-activated malate transporter 13 isoform X2 [Lathyrus oleraceus]|uniref:Variant 3, Aluminum-activated malate transporter 12 n=1 Tax=Pisum sativum TaxID=3888 RepID=A0A9D4YLV0_PEA|nr:aluminum-activated malate transporter 13-like isoform X2 [Pisum sativum]KAI5439560.1 variant 3, Aluminum-activated malate transporter 12 [Pisum sativum]
MFPIVHVGSGKEMTMGESGKWNKSVHVFGERLKRYPSLGWKVIWNVGYEDPRRVIHAFKVGLSLTLASLLYLLEPIYNEMGQSAIWAVMTVVVVLEFTAGATLCKGLNRGLGTLLAGLLAFMVGYIANASPDRISQAVIIGAAIFFIGEDLHNSTAFKLEGLAKSIEACVNVYFYGETDSPGDSNSSEDPIYKGYKNVLDSKSIDEMLALHASWEPRHSRYCHKFPCQQYVKVGAVLRQFSYTVVALHGCLRSEIQTPRSVRAMFKDPCIRVAAEVSKVLIELSNSIRNRRHCSPEILSDHLHEALQDLNNAIKSQPRLFLGSKHKHNHANNMLKIAAAQVGHQVKASGFSLSSVKTDSSALLEWKTKRDSLMQSKENERKSLRPQLSKIAITSLEFSEALPFAAFASLLVETVAKLDFVIEEIEELGRLSCFEEFRAGDEIVVTCEEPLVDVSRNNLPSHGIE